jgi:nucleoid DNA-binding protein
MSLKNLVNVATQFAKSQNKKMSQSFARDLIKHLMDYNAKTLKKEGYVSIYGLGSLSVKQGSRKKMFHFKEKKMVDMAPRKRIKYNAPLSLKKDIQSTKVVKRVAKKSGTQ